MTRFLSHISTSTRRFPPRPTVVSHRPKVINSAPAAIPCASAHPPPCAPHPLLFLTLKLSTIPSPPPRLSGTPRAAPARPPFPSRRPASTNLAGLSRYIGYRVFHVTTPVGLVWLTRSRPLSPRRTRPQTPRCPTRPPLSPACCPRPAPCCRSSAALPISRSPTGPRPQPPPPARRLPRDVELRGEYCHPDEGQEAGEEVIAAATECSPQ